MRPHRVSGRARGDDPDRDGGELPLLADEVITETRRGKVHVATSWRLATRTRAPWKFIEPPGYLTIRGTAVTLKLDNPLSQLLDAGFLAATITTHFQPLFESHFDGILADTYKGGVAFVVARRTLLRDVATVQEAPLAIQLGRKRKPSAVGYLARSAEPLPESQRGVAVSTLGGDQTRLGLGRLHARGC